MPGKISDKKLLTLIHQYQDAEIVCKKGDIKLITLQNRVARLSYLKLIDRPSDIKGLYKPISKTVKLNKNSIIITRARIEGSDFETGDEFKVSFDDHQIILNKVN